MRTYKNKIYNCKVINYDGDILHDKDYFSLLEMSEDLGLTKATIYNINARHSNYNEQYKNFKYYPKIEINKINSEKL
jgi:hypothetical protein